MIGTDPIQFVAGRVTSFGQLVVVIAGADNPPTLRGRGGPLGNGGDQLLDRVDCVTVKRNLVEGGSVRLHVVVRVVEPRRNKMAIEVDRSFRIELR